VARLARNALDPAEHERRGDGRAPADRHYMYAHMGDPLFG
jgi:hypothetical protein